MRGVRLNVKRTFILLFILCGLPLIVQANSVKKKVEQWSIGDTKIPVILYEAGSGLSFFHPHQNEKTSLKAGEKMLGRYGGRLLSFDQSGSRLLHFKLNGKDYRIDPNRIFSKQGIRLTLRRYSHYDAKAAQAVGAFAQRIVSFLPKDLIIAIHNNRPDGYSINEYKPGKAYAKSAESVFQGKTYNAHDLFFVTKRSFYAWFKAKGYNVVLQDNQRVEQDGSLSVYAADKGIPYINIETQNGHLKEQLQMMQALYDLLKTSPLKSKSSSP